MFLSLNKVKASVLVAPHKIETRYFPYPETVPSDAMVVRMEMAGVCGTDKHVYQGSPFAPGEYADVPLIFGHENVGRIDRIGEQAAKNMDVRGRELKEGDRVVWYPPIPCGKCYYCRRLPVNSTNICPNGFSYGYANCEKPENKPWLYGGYAEYVYIKPETWVWKVSEEVPLEAMVMLDTFSSVRGVEKAIMPYPNIKEGFGVGDTVVVQGSGPIGVCAAAKAESCGAGKIIMIGGPEHRLKIAKDFGVDIIINIDEVKKAEDRIEEIIKLTDGVGADMVIDCTGVPMSVPEGIEMVRRAGTYVEIGLFTDKGSVPINPQRFTFKDLRLIGAWYCPPQQYDRDLILIEARKFPFEKLVTHKYKIDEAESALKAHIKYESMKAVIIP